MYVYKCLMSEVCLSVCVYVCWRAYGMWIECACRVYVYVCACVCVCVCVCVVRARERRVQPEWARVRAHKIVCVYLFHLDMGLKRQKKKGMRRVVAWMLKAAFSRYFERQYLTSFAACILIHIHTHSRLHSLYCQRWIRTRRQLWRNSELCSNPKR